jgi:hypothetical protein
MKKELKLPNRLKFTSGQSMPEIRMMRFSPASLPDAVVKDVGREFCGIVEIKEWASQEIFAVNVTLDVRE